MIPAKERGSSIDERLSYRPWYRLANRVGALILPLFNLMRRQRSPHSGERMVRKEGMVVEVFDDTFTCLITSGKKYRVQSSSNFHLGSIVRLSINEKNEVKKVVECGSKEFVVLETTNVMTAVVVEAGRVCVNGINVHKLKTNFFEEVYDMKNLFEFCTVDFLLNKRVVFCWGNGKFLAIGLKEGRSNNEPSEDFLIGSLIDIPSTEDSMNFSDNSCEFRTLDVVSANHFRDRNNGVSSSMSDDSFASDATVPPSNGYETSNDAQSGIAIHQLPEFGLEHQTDHETHGSAVLKRDVGEQYPDYIVPKAKFWHEKSRDRLSDRHLHGGARGESDLLPSFAILSAGRDYHGNESCFSQQSEEAEHQKMISKSLLRRGADGIGADPRVAHYDHRDDDTRSLRNSIPRRSPAARFSGYSGGLDTCQLAEEVTYHKKIVGMIQLLMQDNGVRREMRRVNQKAVDEIEKMSYREETGQQAPTRLFTARRHPSGAPSAGAPSAVLHSSTASCPRFYTALRGPAGDCRAPAAADRGFI